MYVDCIIYQQLGFHIILFSQNLKIVHMTLIGLPRVAYSLKHYLICGDFVTFRMQSLCKKDPCFYGENTESLCHRNIRFTYLWHMCNTTLEPPARLWKRQAVCIQLIHFSEFNNNSFNQVECVSVITLSQTCEISVSLTFETSCQK